MSESNFTQYLFFILDNEKYGIKASFVQEIVDLSKITKVPKANPCVRGITNIRGDLIAVVDPKVRFNQGVLEIQKRTSFIIVNVINEKRDSIISIALMVDLVDEVEDIEADDILKTPEFGSKIDDRFVENIVRYGDDYITILDIEKVLNVEELSIIS